MFESEILKLHLSLGKREEFLVVINAFSWIRCLSFNSDCGMMVGWSSMDNLGLTGLSDLKGGPRVCLLLLHGTSLPIRLASFVWNLCLLSLFVFVKFSIINWLSASCLLQSLGQLFVWVLLLGALKISSPWWPYLLTIFSYCTLTLFRLGLWIVSTSLLSHLVSIWIILRRFVELVDTQATIFLLFRVWLGGLPFWWGRFWDGVLTRRKTQVSLIFFVFFKLLLLKECRSTFLSWGTLCEYLLSHWLVTLCHLLHIYDCFES